MEGGFSMVYLLATFANDAEYLPSLLHALASQLDAPEAEREQETWGVGYFADDRALIIKKPASILNHRTMYALAPEVRSRILLACAKAGTDRELAPPYRFRRWLFAYAGDLSALQQIRATVAEKLPDFIRSEIRENTPGGLAFGMFLAELHRAGRLEDPLAQGPDLGAALARAADTITRLSGEVESGPCRASFVASNGRVVLVSEAGATLSQKVQMGLERLPDGPPDPALTDFKQQAAALKRFRAVVIAPGDLSDRPDWEVIPSGSTRVIDGALKVSAL